MTGEEEITMIIIIIILAIIFYSYCTDGRERPCLEITSSEQRFLSRKFTKSFRTLSAICWRLSLSGKGKVDGFSINYNSDKLMEWQKKLNEVLEDALSGFNAIMKKCSEFQFLETPEKIAATDDIAKTLKSIEGKFKCVSKYLDYLDCTVKKVSKQTLIRNQNHHREWKQKEKQYNTKVDEYKSATAKLRYCDKDYFVASGKLCGKCNGVKNQSSRDSMNAEIKNLEDQKTKNHDAMIKSKKKLAESKEKYNSTCKMIGTVKKLKVSITNAIANSKVFRSKLSELKSDTEDLDRTMNKIAGCEKIKKLEVYNRKANDTVDDIQNKITRDFANVFLGVGVNKSIILGCFGVSDGDENESSDDDESSHEESDYENSDEESD